MMNNQVSTKNDLISYDMCEKCGSLWLDKGQLDKIAFQVEGSIEYCSREPVEQPEKPIRKCPRCNTSNLYRVRFLNSTDIILHHCRDCGGFWLDGGELDLMCPQCHGMWLDQGEFGSVTDYLKYELYSMHSKEMEKNALDEVKLLWSGGPESRYEELLDVRATISALINATIFEHPTLARLCMGAPRI
jgi:Zn-finger nucleic acid-binding protein